MKPASPRGPDRRAEGGARPVAAAAAPWDRLRRYLSAHGLKSTSQRDLIVETFLSARMHINADELTRSVKKRDPHIGTATVYRTLKLLAESGVAVGRNFGDGQMRYEVEDARHHHDHLICEECGKIVEFEDDHIEERQDAIAKRHGFMLVRHKHELYGKCSGCQG